MAHRNAKWILCDWCHTEHADTYTCNAKYYSNHPEEDPDFRYHKPVDKAVVVDTKPVDIAPPVDIVDKPVSRAEYQKEWLRKKRAAKAVANAKS